MKARLLAICDRRLAVLRSALAACESGQQSLLALSDDLLLLDSRGMLLSPFWNDQVH